ncbi:MAG TPA: GNAT family N-acetyltransferase [Thermoanaerobacterales bacterium]|nr:GNAT family N-acetyltransferase [Thermoanaerobacterales bacterium]
MLVNGKKTNLRDIRPTDFDKILKWQKNKLLTYFVCNKLPMSIKECEIRYSEAFKLLNQIFGIEDKNGKFIGEIEIDHIKWKDKQAELFLYIGEEELWGKGYGFDALKTFLDYIFNVRNFKYIYLRVYEHNARAIKCYEKCGFKKRGILKFNKDKIDSDNLILMDIKPTNLKK